MAELFVCAFSIAATLHAFLFVHRLVRLFEQLFETRHAFWFERSDADTKSEFMTARVACVVSFKVFVETRNGVLFVGVEIGDEDGELVAAESRDDVRSTESTIQN